MIRFLSALGRAAVVVGAVLTIAAGAVGGWGWATSDGMISDPARGAVGAALGAVAGIVSAGVVFGPLATLYDIRDNIRRMAG